MNILGWEISYNTGVVLAGVCLLSAGAGVVGCFAVLRRRALMGDALAHAALPGLCLGFLVAGERRLSVLLCGALATGVLGVLVVAGLRRYTRIKEDAAIGIVLSVFYGAGIALTRIIQNLAGGSAGLESYFLGQTAEMIISEVYTIGIAAAACLAVVLLLYKEFKLVAFDQNFANTQGWPVFALDVLLTGLIAVIVVIGLPAVGVMLMAALLIIPPASARFWTDRLSVMLVLSVALGLATGVVGTYITSQHKTVPAGPAVVVVGAIGFVVSLLFAPRRGFFARTLAELQHRRKLARQSLLVEVGRYVESRGSTQVDVEEIAGTKRWTLARTNRQLQTLGALESQSLTLSLTPTGANAARRALHNERLWHAWMDLHGEAAGQTAGSDREAFVEALPPDVRARLEAVVMSENEGPGTKDKGQRTKDHEPA